MAVKSASGKACQIRCNDAKGDCRCYAHSPARTVVTNPSVALLEFLYVTHLSFQTAAKFILARRSEPRGRKPATLLWRHWQWLAKSAPLSSQILCMHAPCRQTFAQLPCDSQRLWFGANSLNIYIDDAPPTAPPPQPMQGADHGLEPTEQSGQPAK